MKKYIFLLVVLFSPVCVSAQFILEGVISKGVFKEGSVFFEKQKSTEPNAPSRLKSFIYIIYNDEKKEEILSDFFLYVEQFNYRNDTLSFIVTVMSGDRYYVLMTEIDQKWEVINSGFVANYDNLPQISYVVKSVLVVDLYNTIIEYNPEYNIPVTLLHFNPKDDTIDLYERVGEEKIGKQDIVIKADGNSYKLFKLDQRKPKFRTK
jgi:hypothetical protein